MDMPRVVDNLNLMNGLYSTSGGTIPISVTSAQADQQALSLTGRVPVVSWGKE